MSVFLALCAAKSCVVFVIYVPWVCFICACASFSFSRWPPDSASGSSSLAMPGKKRRVLTDAQREWFHTLTAMGLSYDDAERITQLAKSAKDDIVDLDGDIKACARRTTASRIDPLIVTETIRRVGSGDFQFTFLHPNRLLSAILEANEPIRKEFFKCLETHPQPWHLLVGLDECWSGNILHESGRKTWIISFSFEELGRFLLSRTAFWWTTCVIRSKIVITFPGGISQAFRLVMRQQLFDSTSGLMTAGLPLQDGSRSVFILFCEFGQLLADGDAWRGVLEAKGGSGLRCCPKCSNCWAKDSDMAHRHVPPHFEITTARPSAFVRYSPRALRGVIVELLEAGRRFRANTMTKTDHDNLQKCLGFAPTLDGVWGDPELVRALQIPVTLTLDWPHCALQEGVLSAELPLYCASLGDKADELDAFLDNWSFADSKVSRSYLKLKQIVCTGEAQGHNRPSCSEYLSFVSVILCWLTLSSDTSPRGRVLGLLCKFVLDIQQAKRCDEGCARVQERLERSWSAWLTAHVALLGSMLVKPKSHWLLHVGEFQRILADCFIIERLHRRAKKFSKSIPHNGFEYALLARIFAHHASPDHPDLVTTSSAMRGGFSTSCQVNGQLFRQGAFVLFDGFAGKILACSIDNGEAFLTVQLCCVPNDPRLVSNESFYSFVSLDPNRSAKWRAGSCTAAVSWKDVCDDVIILHLP